MKDPQFGPSGVRCSGHPAASAFSSVSTPTRPAGAVTNKRRENPLCAQPELCACPVDAVLRACAVGEIRTLGMPACTSRADLRRPQRYLPARPAAAHSRPFRVLVAHGFRQSQRRLAVRGIRERRLAIIGRHSSSLPEMVRGGRGAGETRELTDGR